VERSITHEIRLPVLQLAFVIFIARIFGEIFERFLKQPAVLGELIAGVLFGPYLMGRGSHFPRSARCFRRRVPVRWKLKLTYRFHFHSMESHRLHPFYFCSLPD
jgi:Kef-type K+ transport system membrane component KefB